MGSDLYPRSFGVAKNSETASRLVDEKAQRRLLSAGPRVIGTLTFTSFLMILFYISTLAAATKIFRLLNYFVVIVGAFGKISIGNRSIKLVLQLAFADDLPLAVRRMACRFPATHHG